MFSATFGAGLIGEFCFREGFGVSRRRTHERCFGGVFACLRSSGLEITHTFPVSWVSHGIFLWYFLFTYFSIGHVVFFLMFCSLSQRISRQKFRETLLYSEFINFRTDAWPKVKEFKGLLLLS